MHWGANLRGWLRSLGRRRDLEDGLSDELRFHLDRLIERNVHRGLTLEEARRHAAIEFGGLERVREQTRDQFRPLFVEDLFRDVRYAVRALRRAPAFTATAVLILALGLGATTAVFSVVNGVLIKPLPYPDADTLVSISHTAPGMRIPSMPTGVTQYLTYRDHNLTLTAVGLWSASDATVSGLAEPEQVEIVQMTHGTLQALGVAPALGRWFTRDDDDVAAPPTIILTHGYWRRAFGGDPIVVGRTLILDSLPRTIVGVMPAGFRFLNERPDVLVPFRLNRERLVLGAFNFSSIGRLKPGVDIAEAQADLTRLVPVWLESWPSPPGFQKGVFKNAALAAVVRPLHQAVVGDVGNVLWILFGTIGMVLLIACANVSNLLLVRAQAREQELAVRAALGAGGGRLARELVIESLVLGLIGGLGGLALAYVGLEVLLALGPTTLPRLDEIAIDRRGVTVALFLSCVSGALFSLIPVVKHASPDSTQALRGAMRTSTDSPQRHRTRSTLVVVQVALAAVLLVASGLMVRTFLRLRSIEPGFEPSNHIQLARISIPESLISDPERVLRAQIDIRERLTEIPGVSDVSFASSAPMEPYVSADGLFTEGTSQGDAERSRIRRFKFVSPGFFGSVGIRLVAGRDLSWTDVQQRAAVAVVSENLAREMWRDAASAIGKRIRESPAAPWREIVGVVGNVYDNGPHAPAPATVYWPPILEHFWGEDVVVRRSMTFIVRSEREGSDRLLAELRRAVWAVNGSIPVTEVQTMAGVYRRSMARTSFTVVMLIISGSMALLLGVVGIYGVVAYAVTQRRREIGIRVALGAARGQLERMFVRQGVTLAVVGVVCGSIAAVSAVHVMSALLFGTDSVDPLTYICVGLGLVAAAGLASYLPAHRAATVDPMTALRAE